MKTIYSSERMLSCDGAPSSLPVSGSGIGDLDGLASDRSAPACPPDRGDGSPSMTIRPAAPAISGSGALLPTTHEVSIRGHVRRVPAWRLGDVFVVASGSLVSTAEVFDAYWLPYDSLPDPHGVVRHLEQVAERPDLLKFAQRAPDSELRFDYHVEWDNVAAIPVSSHDHWFNKQVSAATRRNIKASRKKGITVRESPFDDAFVRGIMGISDESPVRAGRTYWHYGKSFETVQAEQGTYRDQATYLGAYVDDELVGYLKMVWDTRTAAIMQIVSKLGALDRRPNNALLSEAVRLCAERGVGHLLYEKFVYGNKVASSLTRFKRENGFVRMDLPTYYVPLTAKGRIALRLGLHRRFADRLPQWLTLPLLQAREKWLALQGTLRAAGHARTSDRIA